MRTLKFIITAQNVQKDPDCDFSGIVAGTEGYLQAEFLFSEEWAGCRTERKLSDNNERGKSKAGKEVRKWT